MILVTKGEKMNLFKRFAFTLNEVMIVLAVLGIVASLTMPALNANIQLRKWNATAQDFEREMLETLRIMNLKKALGNHATTMDFVSKLKNYTRITKICRQDDLKECFPETIYWGIGDTEPVAVDVASVENSATFDLGGWDTEMMGLQFANGVSALITYNPGCPANNLSNDVNLAACTRLLYDTSGFLNPNTHGKDIRKFIVFGNALAGNTDTSVPPLVGGGDNSTGGSDSSSDGGGGGSTPGSGSTLCDLSIGDGCYSFASPVIDYGFMSQDECEARKAELGISECCNSPACALMGENAWAAAVASCGGVANMPDENDLKNLANYLYNTDAFTNGTSADNLTLDLDKAVQLGLIDSTDSDVGYVWIWGKNPNMDYADSLRLGADSAYIGQTAVENGNARVICKK